MINLTTNINIANDIPRIIKWQVADAHDVCQTKCTRELLDDGKRTVATIGGTMTGKITACILVY